MSNSRSVLWSLAGVILTFAAAALFVFRLAGGGVVWWLPLALLLLSTFAFSRR
ncbi:MAG: hypothetical protein LC800_04335 [Acidobacteria bacterium]|nr:hypothetical protein [Acidobacteriota bacterium]